ncbi:ABC transporter permease [Clostridium sp. KNHs214]|uniref:ABC transporter permease n=1 Tax=Clostridium sp. KNHs214 TaxID=1540257 RepID=UPI000555801A|nr:ABC transporter permease [Clostridium sp. KNHs214]
MLFKLALRNSKRSIKKYLLYIVTITLAISFIYAINGLIASEDIRTLGEHLPNFLEKLYYVTVGIILIVAWLVNYMSAFILESRSKELGTYMLLGIESNEISKMFVYEQFILGGVSFVFGILVGTIFLEMIKAIVYRFFEIPFQLNIVFSWKIVSITALAVILIYIFSLIRNLFTFKKFKIYDFMYMEKKNESGKFHRRKDNIFSFLLFSVMLVIGMVGIIKMFYYKNITGKGLFFLLLVIISIYGLTGSISSMINLVFLKGKKRFKEKMILLRFFNSRINTMTKTLGTITILLIASLSCFTIAMFMGDFYKIQTKEYYTFDFNMYWDKDREFVDGIRNLISPYDIKGEVAIENYEIHNTDVYNNILSSTLVSKKQKYETVIKLSDYNKIRKLAGFEAEKLNKNEFLIQTTASTGFIFEERLKKEEYNIAGHKLNLKEIKSDPMQTEDIGFFKNYYLVVPDEFTKEFKYLRTQYIWNTKKETDKKLSDNILKYYNQYENMDYKKLPVNFKIKGTLLEEGKSSMVLIILALLYIALIFSIILATVLAVSQITEGTKYKYRYKLLNDIGMDKTKIQRLILKQTTIQFSSPLVLGLPISILFVWAFSFLMEGYTSQNFFLNSVISAMGMFLFIYVIYYVATYVTYKQSVLE